jgi:hypothetical protein
MMQARMRRISLFSVLGFALVVILGGTAFAQSTNSEVGTWKLNLAKSRFDPGPPPMSETIVNEVWETDGLAFTDTEVEADGTRVTSGCSFHYDGKDYNFTFTEGTPDVDTIAVKRVDANTVTYTNKKGGNVVETGTVVVSNNGKVLTITWTAMNAKGQKENGVEVYDKQ